MELQPLLHDLLVAVAAPVQAWSGADGQIAAHGAQGGYHGDVRILSRAEVHVAGAAPEHVAGGGAGPGRIEVISLVRGVGEEGADPTMRLRRTRTVTPRGIEETLVLEAATREPVRVPLEMHLACDLAAMDEVKAGRRPHPLAAGPGDATAEAASARWPAPGGAVTVTAPGAAIDLTDPRAPIVRWDAEVEPDRPWHVTWTVRFTGVGVTLAPPARPTWSTPVVVSDDRRLPALLDRALEDLAGLRMSVDFAPDDVFLAAGAPWFFTLFGRDSIWAARMLLPLGTELAGGTLRALAARQGTVEDPATAEQPGKILHEVRAAPLSLGEPGKELPPLYYGTVDATPLWVCLLHDAWRWGLPAAKVEALLPAMEAALEWMARHGDADGDGFLEYLDLAGTGLANQGWKDSGDSVQWRDGTLAEGPIALCEVQAYAHEAALGGAALLDAFGRPGAERWRAWAADLAVRFREQFWVSDEHGPYPAIALDARKRPVDSLTSNIGHLLGTGLLDAREEGLIAARLGGPQLNSGYGLRTLASDSGGYWPLRYHGGAVWTHDTAIAVTGLVRSGHHDVAASLMEGLLAAAAELDYRSPELYAGDARGTVPAVVPYPAACRPQAWSAASAVVLLSAALGLEPDAPGGALRLTPMSPSPFGRIAVEGLRLGGEPVDVTVAADGTVDHLSVSATGRKTRMVDGPRLDQA